METRQLEHEGFEHLNEWRVPINGDWFQTDQGNPYLADQFVSSLAHGGKRWILRKKYEIDRYCTTCCKKIPTTPEYECYWCGSKYNEHHCASHRCSEGNPQREQAIKDLDNLKCDMGVTKCRMNNEAARLGIIIEKLKEAI